MARLIAGLGLAAVLVILALQNLSPSLTLVVLGAPTLTLPFSAWLLGSIALGVVLTLIISALLQLATPNRRPYRPLGQRIRPQDAAPGPAESPASYATDCATPSDYRGPVANDETYHTANDTENDPGTAPRSGAFVRPEAAGPDWDDYQPASQREDWGQPQPPTERRGFRTQREPYAVDTTVDDLEAGWDGYNDGYGTADYQNSNYSQIGRAHV